VAIRVLAQMAHKDEEKLHHKTLAQP
jgi:hypothetical protein